MGTIAGESHASCVYLAVLLAITVRSELPVLMGSNSTPTAFVWKCVFKGNISARIGYVLIEITPEPLESMGLHVLHVDMDMY